MQTVRLPNQPYALPVSLDSLAYHTRVADTAAECTEAQRRQLTEYAQVASQVWERATRQPVMQAQYVSIIDRFSGAVSGLVGPVSEVSSVEYVDEAGMVVSLDPASYTRSLLRPDTLLLPGWRELPRVYAQAAEPIRIYYTAGAATVDEVPPIQQQFIKLMVAHYYENPQAVVVGMNINELPLGAQSLIDMEREPVL